MLREAIPEAWLGQRALDGLEGYYSYMDRLLRYKNTCARQKPRRSSREEVPSASCTYSCMASMQASLSMGQGLFAKKYVGSLSQRAGLMK